MLKLFERVLDAFIQGFGRAVADIRDKGLFEAFFNLKTPERPGSDWFLDRSEVADQAKGSVLDMFYDRLSPAERAEHFREPPGHEQGIER